jgi:hypothetical protein
MRAAQQGIPKAQPGAPLVMLVCNAARGPRAHRASACPSLPSLRRCAAAFRTALLHFCILPAQPSHQRSHPTRSSAAAGGGDVRYSVLTSSLNTNPTVSSTPCIENAFTVVTPPSSGRHAPPAHTGGGCIVRAAKALEVVWHIKMRPFAPPGTTTAHHRDAFSAAAFSRVRLCIAR